MSSTESGMPIEPTPLEIAMVAATLANRGEFLKNRSYTGTLTHGELYIENARYLLNLAARKDRQR